MLRYTPLYLRQTRQTPPNSSFLSFLFVYIPATCTSLHPVTCIQWLSVSPCSLMHNGAMRASSSSLQAKPCNRTTPQCPRQSPPPYLPYAQHLHHSFLHALCAAYSTPARQCTHIPPHTRSHSSGTQGVTQNSPARARTHTAKTSEYQALLDKPITLTTSRLTSFYRLYLISYPGTAAGSSLNLSVCRSLAKPRCLSFAHDGRLITFETHAGTACHPSQ